MENAQYQERLRDMQQDLSRPQNLMKLSMKILSMPQETTSMTELPDA